MDDVKISSNRSFGIVFFIVFLLIALYPLTYSQDIRVWSTIISIIFLVLGLLMRLLGKDLINLKYNNNKSYWIEKNDPKSKMKNQF